MAVMALSSGDAFHVLVKTEGQMEGAPEDLYSHKRYQKRTCLGEAARPVLSVMQTWAYLFNEMQ